MNVIEHHIPATDKEAYWQAIKSVVRLYDNEVEPFVLLVHYKVSQAVPAVDRFRGASQVWKAAGKRKGTHYIVVSCDTHLYTQWFAQWIPRIFKGNIEAHICKSIEEARATAHAISRNHAHTVGR